VVTYAAGHDKVTATGWAVDPDVPKTAVKVRVQLTTGGCRRPCGNRNLATVPSTKTPVDFALTIATSRGRHVVCYFAVNIGAGATGGLGCRTVTVT
jgi:hypothetical protein